ncbi:hypothetical protein D0861_02628 [Hortaea werneckii]|uniref:Uncharacterized protein n=1 Tax=Hortaea werneckii TaxID=91943 RepID=A0A3M7FTK0_HORWE|nr:hypothetical protein D0861_02628 [Hortaea werneckii]
MKSKSTLSRLPPDQEKIADTIVKDEYIRGTATNDECEPLFQQYKTCLSSVNALRLTPAQKALKDRGIDQMLEEARADNKENDIEYMKPNGR